MGQIFFWIAKPTPFIPDTTWAAFKDGMAAMGAIVVAVVVVVTLLLYRESARRRKVLHPGDLFAPYTPMYSIFIAVAGALFVGIWCSLQYVPSLATSEGQFGVSAQIGLVCGLAAACISYLLIAFVSDLTPAKFCYRPFPFGHKGRVSGA
jgi:sterol desaturase/sphingolipid hydroxylase (fatty acid hydroxylase superfamily)